MALTRSPIARAVASGAPLVELTPHPGIEETWAVHVTGCYVGIVTHHRAGSSWQHLRGGGAGPMVGTRAEAIVTLLTTPTPRGGAS